MSKNEILLNHIFLKNRIIELGIKQWWLAEQAGVDRKTVIRWTHGQVKSIQVENAQRLAKILNCKIEDLSLNTEADKLATSEDQKAAAKLLISSSLFEKLGPIGEWNLIESLLKANVVPNLPLNILGEVYDKLTVASWRQSKIDQAALYNFKAEEIARKTGDMGLLASALLSKANIYSWRGEVFRSIETYEQCLELEKYIEPKILGATYSNLGAVLYESGNISKGEQLVRKSIEIFNQVGNPVNLSIAHCHLAIIYLQIEELELAAHETKVSINYANMDDFRRGKAQGKILQAEIAANNGLESEARRLATEALEDFAQLSIFEGLNFEQVGRVYRLLGELDVAEKHFLKGIELAHEFPIYLAALYTELAQVLKMQGRVEWAEKARAAIEIYQKCHCPLRIEKIRKQFQIN